ncbi:MAG: hypothetical protein ACI89L_000196 [Phycisphaerales bacterium]|jgi:hypothetical protein
MKRSALIKRLAVLAAFVTVGVGSYAKFYAIPVKQKQDRLQGLRETTATYKENTPSSATITRARRELEAVVLAVKVDDFEHLLRTELSRLAAQASLGEVVVSHSDPAPVMSPIISTRRVERAFTKPLKSKPDFYQVQGKLSGRGTPEAVSQTIALIQSQPWVQQIQTVKITPLGKQRRNMQLDLGFAVLFSPTAALPADHATQIVPADPAALQAAMALASRPIFRPPDPVREPAPTAVATTPTPPPAAVPQDGNWRITGIITDPTPEVWLVNSIDAQQRVLGVGEGILNATVVGVQPDHAQILIDDIRYRVQLGRTLADRQPIVEEEPS